MGQWLRLFEPEAVEERKYARKKRHRFWCAGLNDFWSFDQHDKWGPRFGLWFHLGTEPLSGEVKWLKIWWNNRNPHLITSYYLKAARKMKGEFDANVILTDRRRFPCRG